MESMRACSARVGGGFEAASGRTFELAALEEKTGLVTGAVRTSMLLMSADVDGVGF